MTVRERFSRSNRARLMLATVAAGMLAVGCQTAEEQFTEGRIENLCAGAIPVCAKQAGCVLQSSEYLRGAFPGGLQVIVRTPAERSRLVVRFLLQSPTFGGSEMQVIGYDAGCADYSEEHPRDRNILELAGDDGVLEFHVDVKGRGDHLVEVFSDMGSPFLMAVDIDE